MVKRKAKGTRMERDVAKAFQDAGIQAGRVPGSGAFQFSQGSSEKDIWATIGGRRWDIECKARANGEGFKVLDGWLGSSDLLVLKQDRQPPMVFMTLDRFLEAVGSND